MRLSLARKLATLPLGYFDRKTTGEIKKVLNEQVERLEEGIAHFLPDVVSSITVPVVTIIVLFVFDWRLTLAMLAILPLWFVLMGGAFRRSAVEEMNRIAVRLNSIIIQYVNGIKVIKAFTRSMMSVKEFRTVVNDIAKVYVKNGYTVCCQECECMGDC